MRRQGMATLTSRCGLESYLELHFIIQRQHIHIWLADFPSGVPVRFGALKDEEVKRIRFGIRNG